MENQLLSTSDVAVAVTDQVEDLLSQMTLEQKVAQLQCTIPITGHLEAGLAKFPHGLGASGSISTGVSIEADADHYDEVQEAASAKTDLSIPPLLHGEAVSGWTGLGGTVFPSAIGLGATWSPDTIEGMTDIVRGQMLSVGVRQALSPIMDVARDPRWGRVGETYGEDPTLCAAMSVAFVKGLQGPDLQDGVAATGKHFLGFGLSEGGLNMTSNPIPPRELREVFAKPFQAAITEANLAGIMNSYGTIDGELIIASKHILDDLLREEMGFEGLVVSDYMSINLAVDLNVGADPTDGGIKALKAGLDVELPTPYGFTDGLVEAVKRGDLEERFIDRAVRRMLTLKARLGLLENNSARKELIAEAYEPISTKAHSLKTARESIVLLKNDGLLPLSKATKKIAVIGPHGNSLRLFFGCYTYPASIDLAMSGTMSEMAGMLDLPELTASYEQPPLAPLFEGSDVRSEPEAVEQALQGALGHKTPTIVASIKAKCPEADVVYEKGCDIAGTNRTGFDAAVAAAKDADVVILTLGGKYGWGSSCTSGEGIDTSNVGLPGIQEELARQIFETGTPTVMVHMDAKPLSSVYIAEHFPAVIENWFPGETGGEALADVLFGDYNPAGRLPMTAVRDAGQIPLYAAHKRSNSFSSAGTMIMNRYVDGSKVPLFHFGEGKSYTTFEYSNLTLDPTVKADGVVHLSCEITNTGQRDGEEVVQVYVRDELASMVRPVQELAGFNRVELKAGQTKTVHFTMRADQFAFLDVDMQWVVEAGQMTVKVGASSADTRLTGAFDIENTAIIDGKRRGFYATTSVS
ncbi:glycoside hydrolase family 3 C-terminal domain-containing protein [Pseudarthrobacter sp. R1]|uniref:glycoside hydrolase family 3 N-terminal domain-containing protein n=1 Tax=Pseudarthrobacter sp. R1 TaxID=2944934 RepID=UPI002108FA23|nr:glycoside hydrolase family 3 N-terminal domain-containing protein [Pseudarthrobacter sp. R1]MCQ6271448.1 glycoside hydrolase family 3 C-terminal domain-containing protein [Pseudarthrobacter sp. R1]